MQNKSSPAYWHDRKVQYDETLGKDEKRLYSKLAAYYEREAARLDKEIAAYYAKYSINGVLSYRNLLETLPDEDKLLLEKSKLELEAEKAKDDKLIRILTTVTSVGVTIAGFAVGSHWYGKGFKFEETGTICSSTFKGLMKDFRFFRK